MCTFNPAIPVLQVYLRILKFLRICKDVHCSMLHNNKTGKTTSIHH